MMMGSRIKMLVKAALPFMAMVMVEVIEVGFATISKAAMSKGMNNFVFVVYYNALGTAVLFPAFAYHSLRSKRPPITFSLLSRFFLLGLIGLCLSQASAFAGINYTSPTLAAAMANLIPVFTFVLAVILRMEKLDLRKVSSQAKSLGTVVAISGALIATLYKGPPLLMGRTSNVSHQLLSQHSKWLIGCLLLASSFLLLSIWNIIQAATAKEYPDELTIVFFYSFFGTIQSAFLSFLLVKNPIAWKLQKRVELIAVVYGALSVTVLRNVFITWCLRETGPVFVGMFKPLGIAIAVLMGFLFLGDTLYLGSMLGAAGIVLGFYAVIWGRARENNNSANESSSSVSSSDQKTTPLLQSIGS
ncbi:hypothetical protein Dimus_011282 [Dionaea muscipula]